jgi:hypothetical protein
MNCRTRALAPATESNWNSRVAVGRHSGNHLVGLGASHFPSYCEQQI